MDNLAYLFAAYVVIWIGIFAHMLSVDNRQRSLSQEVEVLKMALAESQPSPPPA